MSRIEDFSIAVPQSELDDLRGRLRHTRWPEAETVDDWSQGVPLAYMRRLSAEWSETYDWRDTQARLNALPQVRTEIGGLRIHAVHARSPHANAMPLILTHGWPGSFLEFEKIIQPLTRPDAHGGSVTDAFHVVCPSLPGYGFSDKPATPGWGCATHRGRLGRTDGQARLRPVWRGRQRLGHQHQHTPRSSGRRPRRGHPPRAAARGAGCGLRRGAHRGGTHRSRGTERSPEARVGVLGASGHQAADDRVLAGRLAGRVVRMDR